MLEGQQSARIAKADVNQERELKIHAPQHQILKIIFSYLQKLSTKQLAWNDKKKTDEVCWEFNLVIMIPKIYHISGELLS